MNVDILDFQLFPLVSDSHTKIKKSEPKVKKNIDDDEYDDDDDDIP